MGEKKHYGYGRWHQAQFYAIVRSYDDAGRSPEWIAKKLGVTEKHVRQVLNLHLTDGRHRQLDRELDQAVDQDV